MLRSFAKGLLDEAARTDILGVSFDHSPSFTKDALMRAYGLPFVPEPLRSLGGSRVGLSDREILTLSAAMRAITQLSTEVREAEAVVEVDDWEVGLIAFV
jgi:hypothetical protein